MTPQDSAHSIAQWCANSASLQYKGYRIFVRIDGPRNAPALLLIHGFPTASWDWSPLWNALIQEYRVITLDMIGFGFSEKPKNYAYSIIDQADLCEHLLNTLRVTDYHILAHDYGDSVAQELLARQNSNQGRPKLHSVCFLNGGLFPESHRPLFMQRLLASPAGRLVGHFASRRSLATSMQRIFGPATPPDEDTLDGFWHLMAYNDGLSVLHRLIAYMAERRVHRDRWIHAMQRTAIPLRLINGAKDPISGAHMAKRYSALIPHPDIVLLNSIGHYPQIEAPRSVLDAWGAFMASMKSHMT